MSARLPRLVPIAAGVMRGDGDALRSAIAEALAAGEAAAARDVLRLMHLFVGFPRAIRAWNQAAEALAAAAAEPQPAEGQPAAEAAAEDAQAGDARARGEDRFRRVYGEDADRVLAHLRALDPRLSAWILEHAYGRAADGRTLTLEEVERLSVLALAHDRCWQQCRSHLRACRRLGVPAAALAADAAGAGGWPDAEARRALVRAVDEVYDGA